MLLLTRSIWILVAFQAVALAAISRHECQEQGGEIVGDIGNGAIFRPDYLCAADGNPPTDLIVAAIGEPMAVDGEVCCGGVGKGLVPETSPQPPRLPPLVMGNGMPLPKITAKDCRDIGGVLEKGVSRICELSGLPAIATVPGKKSKKGKLESMGQMCCPIAPTIQDSNEEREELTRAECLDVNGTIVGDIGNGAIFEKDYICDSNGRPPIANIIQTGTPAAIEGEVCCGRILDRISVSRQECRDRGGQIVADVGDGSSRREDYTCPNNGQPPLANIVPLPGEPLSDEGEVCCGSLGGSVAADRPGVTTEECIELGGEIIGDIGDGSTRREDYVCVSNGSPPLGNIVYEEGQPMPIEGAVCCGLEDDANVNVLVSRQECLDMGGVLVGDIGDGSTRRDDYVCETNGEPPIAFVVPLEGEPIAREGEVCCGSLGGTVSADRPGVTTEECIEVGGEIIGDIGDGSTRREDYVCVSNGSPPLGNIVYEEGQPMPIEGAVCCGLEDDANVNVLVSRQECLDMGGVLVGDIGDGSTRRDDYVCETNGEPPIAFVVPLEGEPIATEGEVCCGQSLDDGLVLPSVQALEQGDGAFVSSGGILLGFAALLAAIRL